MPRNSQEYLDLEGNNQLLVKPILHLGTYKSAIDPSLLQ